MLIYIKGNCVATLISYEKVKKIASTAEKIQHVERCIQKKTVVHYNLMYTVPAIQSDPTINVVKT